uniref:Uncharacterized protein n=1 Tax=Streptomyces avermitilis TaxID=33903 RepID=A0A499W3Z2_STRAX|nr:hypothetical protein SAVMC3_62860 [Streptomyces avermitilis]
MQATDLGNAIDDLQTNKANLAGDTFTGPVVLSGTGSDLTVGGVVNTTGPATVNLGSGSPSYASLPKGIAGRSENAGLIIGSSYIGGTTTAPARTPPAGSTSTRTSAPTSAASARTSGTS